MFFLFLFGNSNQFTAHSVNSTKNIIKERASSDKVATKQTRNGI